MINLSQLEVWFVTGSQHLYGEAVLKTVAEHAKIMAKSFDKSDKMAVQVNFKAVVTTPDEIYKVCQAANTDANCIGIIAWMHTFSPAKMWIRGLQALQKPLCHLHTQFNRDIPFSEIDMDFMNLNQSAHGDREFGFMMSRLRMERKVIVGHWQDPSVIERLNVWTRVAAARFDWQGGKFARFGDNMRQVAVTEGDKVEAEMQFGYSVNGYGVGDLVQYVHAVSEKDIDNLVSEYAENYVLQDSLSKNGAKYASLREAAKIELGIKNFLKQGNFKGYTDTFEDLHGLTQLPGIASQRLMAAGYGFGAEGDWKTAALVRAAKVMASGMAGGNSFMEDYTYHFDPANQLVLGAHMLEICPSIANKKPSCEIHPLGIGGKSDPVRLVFDAAGGKALNVSMIHLGNRFRLIVHEVEAVEAPAQLPKLPVARAFWRALPDMATGCAAWIYAGGAHHTVYSQNLTTEYWEDFAAMIGVELVVIDAKTDLRQFKNELRWNEVTYRK
jgi:L-arabinose isomerase